MAPISIVQELEERLQALGIPNPTSPDVEYYFHNPVQPGQPEQTKLPFLLKTKDGVWKAGQLNHTGIGYFNVDSLESQNMELDVDSFGNEDSVVSIHDSDSADTQGCQTASSLQNTGTACHLA